MTSESIKESRKRSIAKTITWRFTASGSTLIVSYVITGSWIMSGTIVGINFFLLMIFYYFHERLWNIL